MEQTISKSVHYLDGKDDPLRIVKKIKIWLYYKIYKPESTLKSEAQKIFWNFD